MPSRSARKATRIGTFFRWAELRSLERKTFACRALCQLIPSVTRQHPALDRRCRIAPFDRDDVASKAQSRRRRGVQLSLSRRKVDLPKAFHPDHLAPTGERSAAGRVRGDRNGVQQTTRRCRSRPMVRSKLTLHQPTQCALPAHSVPIYYNGVFLEFRTCTCAVKGMKFGRNILSRMDLNFFRKF